MVMVNNTPLIELLDEALGTAKTVPLDMEHLYDYKVCTSCLTDIKNRRVVWDIEQDLPFCSAQCMADYILESGI